jgi:exonuclease III
VVELITSFSPIDRSFRQKLNRETMKQADTMNQMDLTDIYRIFHPKIKEYTFLTAPHGSFSKIKYIIGHKACINRYKRIKITP